MPTVESGDESYRWRRAWVYELDTGGVRQVSREGSNVWEAVWCGNAAVAAVVSPGPREGLWYSARLQIMAIENGSGREIYNPRDQIGWPAASPSGKHLVVVEAVCSDRGIVAGDLRLIDTTSGNARQVDTHGVDISYTEWRSDEHLLLAGHRGFETVVGLYEAGEIGFRELWSSRCMGGTGRYASVSGSATAVTNCALAVDGFQRSPEIGMIREGCYRTLRSFDLGYAEQAAAIGAVETLTWSAPDGLEIQGWLLRPRGQAPHALVMHVHGGPVWHWRSHWLGRRAYDVADLLLLQRGYAVFYPNPRGSSGRGQDFARQVFGDPGGAEALDNLFGLDHLVTGATADSSRLGVIGGSHGGFMASWLTTQDQRFAAAVAFVPVTDRVSQYLTCTHSEYISLLLADKYNNPLGLSFQRSPIMHAHKTSTPTLNVAGALDRCTPAQQAVEFHRALVGNGVRSALVVYPQEGHGVQKLPAAIDFATRVVAWFEEHMPIGEPGERPAVSRRL